MVVMTVMVAVTVAVTMVMVTAAVAAVGIVAVQQVMSKLILLPFLEKECILMLFLKFFFIQLIVVVEET